MQGLLRKAERLQIFPFLISSPSFYCWTPLVTQGQLPWLLPPKFLCTLGLSGKTRKGLDCSAPARTPLCFGHKTRAAAEKEMSESQPNPVVCHSFWCWQPVPAVCVLWCFLKVVFEFQCFKANIDHCAIQVCLWFSPAVSTELIHGKHCAVSLGDHCHFLFN